MFGLDTTTTVSGGPGMEFKIPQGLTPENRIIREKSESK